MDNLIRKRFLNLVDSNFKIWEPFREIKPFKTYKRKIKKFVVFLNDAGCYTEY